VHETATRVASTAVFPPTWASTRTYGVRKSLFTIKQNGSRIEHIKGKKTIKQDSENT